MSRIRSCSVEAPTEPVPANQSFELIQTGELVNNALSCRCVRVSVTLMGAEVNSFTVSVDPGGGLNPKRVRVTTPMGPPRNAPIDIPTNTPIESDFVILNETICDPCSRRIDHGTLEIL